MHELYLLCAGAFVAGYVDAIGGGGGLIQLPVLLLALPQTPVVTLLAVNKSAAVCGTFTATVRYLSAVKPDLTIATCMALCAGVSSLIGAFTAAQVAPEWLRPIIVVLLVFAAAYTYWHKDFGLYHMPRVAGVKKFVWGSVAGMAIGFYDGFFGPGTGTLLMLLFVAFFGFDFLRAAAHTKIVNVTTNLAALAFFVWDGHVEWRWALPMAVANVAGGFTGAHMAVVRGNRFMRKVTMLVILIVIVRYAHDMIKAWLR